MRSLLRDPGLVGWLFAFAVIAAWSGDGARGDSAWPWILVVAAGATLYAVVVARFLRGELREPAQDPKEKDPWTGGIASEAPGRDRAFVPWVAAFAALLLWRIADPGSQALAGVAAPIAILIAPGFAISRVLLPDWNVVARAFVSPVLSIGAVVPIAIWFDALGLRMGPSTVITVVAGLIVLCLWIPRARTGSGASGR